MIGSDSIGSLSRATGDEQLLKSQRVGDKKSKQEDGKRNKDKRNKDTAKPQEFEAVIVSVGSVSNIEESEAIEAKLDAASVREGKDKHATKPDSQEDGTKIQSQGHIDVVG